MNFAADRPSFLSLKTKATPAYPWEGAVKKREDLYKVVEYRGSLHHTEMRWIPGVVLAVVHKTDQLNDAIDDLKEALGTEGTTQGVLFVSPYVTDRPTNVSLARHRVRMKAALQEELDRTRTTEPVIAMGLVADGYLVNLGRRAFDRLRRHHLRAGSGSGPASSEQSV
jgi:hypothetical protein